MPFFRKPAKRNVKPRRKPGRNVKKPPRKPGRTVKKQARKPVRNARISSVSISPRYAALVKDAKRLSIPTANLGEMYRLLIEHGKTPKQILTAETERLIYSGSEKNYAIAEKKARKHLESAGINV